MRRRPPVAVLLFLAVCLFAPFVARSAPAAVPTTEVLALRSHVGGGTPRAVASTDRLLFAGFGPTLQIVDIGRPATPTLRSRLTLSNLIWGLAAADSTVYVLLLDAVTTRATLVAVDVSNPDAPRAVAEAAVAQSAGFVLAGDGLVYVASRQSVSVFDAAPSARLAPVATITPPGLVSLSPEPIALAGKLLLVAAETELLIYDLSDPRSPIQRSRSPIYGVTAGFSVSAVGAFAYLSAAQGLQVLDFADPSSPRMRGSNLTGAYDLHGLGPYVVGLGGAGVAVYNVSDPERLVLETTRRFGEMSGNYADMTVAAGHAYITVDGGVVVVSLADPVTPVVLGVLDARPYTGPVALGGAYLYVPGQVFSLADPDRPAPVGAYDGALTAVEGARGYSVNGGFQIYSLADPAAPVRLGSYGGLNIGSFAVRGDYAYLSDGGWCNRGGCMGAGLHVVNIADPAQPSRVVFLPELILWSPVVAGSYLYALVGADLNVISLADPASPAQVARLAVPLAQGQWLGGLKIDRGRLYLLTSGELLIYDLADPAAPRLAGRAGVGGYAFAVDGPFAYIFEGELLRVVDVADMQAPRVRGGTAVISFGIPIYGSPLAVRGDRVYAGLGGLYAFQRVRVELVNAVHLPVVARH